MVRICARKIIIFCLFSFATWAIYAQNGVSLDEIRANPYFQNQTNEENSQSTSQAPLAPTQTASSQTQVQTSPAQVQGSSTQAPVSQNQAATSSAQESATQTQESVLPNPTQPQAPFQTQTSSQQGQQSQNQSTQYQNPAESSSFYNSANWQDAGNSNFSYPNQTNQSNVTNASETQSLENSIYQEGDPLLTDNEKRGKFPWLPLDESHFILSIFYNPNYILSFTSKDIAYYFNLSKFFNFELIGAGVKAQYLFARKPNFSLAGGFCVSWNYLRNVQTYYTLQAQQILGVLTFGADFLFSDYFLFDLHANAGILSLFNIKFDYSSGATEGPKSWIYPVVGAGFECDFYLAKNWSLGLGGDFNWPLLIEKPYPIIQIKLNSGWRF